MPTSRRSEVKLAGPEGGEYWLPESFHLHLTALEAGALFAIVAQYQPPLLGLEINVKGRKKPMSIKEVILKKMERARKEMD